ncbi:hypothetical protein F2Q70_00031808 [Brassica cretica]|uniref:Uncharacterized protein n=1 Tax=Brassica cretica TaxID=69181 RepID=A0A8S9FQP3_BRACR|nr:hypothetical protein F2Q70_00031808 [Brassica cretica]
MLVSRTGTSLFSGMSETGSFDLWRLFEETYHHHQSPDEQHKMATLYKSEKRDEMVKEGYRIRGNSGDQWSDLLGSSISQRSFKLPNPMYYIP